MTDLTQPAEQEAAADNTAWGHALGKAGTGAWIVDGVDIANIYAALDETQLDAFRHSTTSGLDVTIAAGEAYVSGWLCRDRTTTVTLPASSTTTIYVGYDASAVIDSSVEAPSDNDNIIVGPAGDFAGEDPRTELYTFTTDSTTVTSSEDHRKLTQPLEYDPIDDIVSGTRLGINRETGAAPLEIRGNAETGTSIALHTLNDAGTTQEERASVMFHDDSENRIGNLAAHTHSTGHHLSLYGYDGTHTGFKAFDVESNGEFNFGPDLSRVFAQSELRVDHQTLSGLVLQRTDSPSQRINMINGSGQTVEVRQVGDQLRIIGNDGNHISRYLTGGGVEVPNGLVDNSGGDGVKPHDIAGGALPSDTQAGRILYDSSREQ